MDCGLYLLDTDTNEGRLLSTAGVGALAPLWKPDGTQLAFIRSDVDQEYTLLVIDAANGNTLYSGKFDVDAWQTAGDAPVSDWGLEMQRGYQGSNCFVEQ